MIVIPNSKMCTDAQKLLMYYQETVRSHAESVMLLNKVLEDRPAFAKALAMADLTRQASREAHAKLQTHLQEHGC